MTAFWGNPGLLWGGNNLADGAINIGQKPEAGLFEGFAN